MAGMQSIIDAIVDTISEFAKRNNLDWIVVGKVGLNIEDLEQNTFCATIVIEAEKFVFTDLEYLDDILEGYDVHDDFRILPCGNKLLVVIEVPPNALEED